LRLAGLDWSVPDFSTVCRRQWRKVHLGIDAQTLEIRAIEVTDNSVEDGAGGAPVLLELLAQIPPEETVFNAGRMRWRPRSRTGSCGRQH
jgi:hypothetical protein